MSVKDLTHETIADTAYRILCIKPLAKFTMKELAEACNVSKPTLYHHFQDKYAVAQYICKRFSDAFYQSHSFSEILNVKETENSFYIFRYADFFRNVLSYQGQDNIFDYLAKLEIDELLREAREICAPEKLPEDVIASAEYYAYSVWHAMYAMLEGKIPQRFRTSASTAMRMYWPPVLIEIFSRRPVQ